MGRSSLDPRIQLQDCFVKLKRVMPDLYFDLNAIYNYKINYLKDYAELDGYQRILQNKKHVEGYIDKNYVAYSPNRLYIVSAFWHVTLLLENIDNFVIEHMQEFFLDNRGKNYEPPAVPLYLSTLFIFEGDKLTLVADLPDNKLCEIINCFYKQNLVSKKDGNDSWYNQPKKQNH